MGGEARDNHGHLTDDQWRRNKTLDEIYHMKPVYEGYFYTIHWVPSVLPSLNGIVINLLDLCFIKIKVGHRKNAILSKYMN